MNNEYKYILIENETEFKNNIISEISEIKNELSLLEFIDKIISIQYYKGFFMPNEYDEILSNKINEIINIEIKNVSYIHNEFKYFLKMLLESYDLFLSKLTFNEIENSTKIKASYLIDEYDSLYYLDEINPEYLDEIMIYNNKDELIDYINFNLIYDMPEYLRNYFNYDEFISDSDIIKYDKAYIENLNLY